MSRERPDGRLRRLAAAVLPGTEAGRRLLVVFFIDSFGTGMFVAGSTVFFTQHVGLTPGQVSIGLSLSALVGLVCTVPVGVLADRFGIRRMQVLLHLWRGTGYVLYTFVGTFPAFLLVAAMIGVGDRCSPPLNQALVSLSVEQGVRVRTMGLLRAARNLAFVLGGLAAVGLIAGGGQAGYDALVLVNAATFAVAAVIVGRLPILRSDRRAEALRLRVPALTDRRYLALAGAHGALSLHASLLLVGLPLFALEHTPVPHAAVGAIWVVNSAVVTFGQVRFAKGAESLEGATAVTLRAGGWLVAMCAAGAVASLAGSWAIVALFAAVLLLSMGEMLQAAGAWGMSYALAPTDRQGEYLSVFSLGYSIEGIVGPTLVTALVVHREALGWTVMAVLFAASTLLARVVARRASPPAGADAEAAAQSSPA